MSLFIFLELSSALRLDPCELMRDVLVHREKIVSLHPHDEMAETTTECGLETFIVSDRRGA